MIAPKHQNQTGKCRPQIPDSRTHPEQEQHPSLAALGPGSPSLCAAVPPMGIPAHGGKEAAMVGARSPPEGTRSHHQHPLGPSRAAGGERGALRSLSPCALLSMGKQGQMEPHPSPSGTGAGSSRLAPGKGTASVPGSCCQLVTETRVLARRQQSPRQEQSVR